MPREPATLCYVPEAEQIRERRRSHLFQLDGLLAFAEEHNSRNGGGAPVPPVLLTRLHRIGGPWRTSMSGADYVEAVFLLQEQFLRLPVQTLEWLYRRSGDPNYGDKRMEMVEGLSRGAGFDA